MPTPCPSCSFQVKDPEAYDCPSCGEPLEEETALDLSLGLTHAILAKAVDEDPLVARGMDLLHQLEAMAPEVAAWRQLPSDKRGRMPALPPALEPQVQALMREMSLVGDELQAAREAETTVH